MFQAIHSNYSKIEDKNINNKYSHLKWCLGPYVQFSICLRYPIDIQQEEHFQEVYNFELKYK